MGNVESDELKKIINLNLRLKMKFLPNPFMRWLKPTNYIYWHIS